MLNAQEIAGYGQCFEQFHHATCLNYSDTDYRWIQQKQFKGSVSARSTR